jgi:ABC-type multidrug transport system ATPase subunit
MVGLKHVFFKYSDNDSILEDASLEIKKGNITVLLGKNGIGKTTLLSLIDGYLEVDSGDITKKEENAYIFDHPYLYEYLTGEVNKRS